MGTFSDYGKKQVLNEAYFGKSKDLKDAERILGIYRRKYFKHKYLNTCNSDPLLYQFEDILADFFGFKSFFMDVQPMAMVNAATLPVSYLLSGATAKIKKTKDGFKYDGTPSMYMYIYSYLLFNEDFTDGEVMSIILHEIGHNFSAKRSKIIFANSMYWFIYIFYDIIIHLVTLDIQGLAGDITYTEVGRQALRDLREYISSSKVASAIHGGAKFLLTIPKNLIYNILIILQPFVGVTRMFDILQTQLMKQNIFIVSGFIDERIADNFATIYGYGSEAVSAELKMENYATPSRHIISQIPLVGWMYDILNIPFNFVTTLGDPHPTTVSRAKAQYNYLLNEIDKVNKPRLKKEIEEDIKKCEEAMDKLDKDSKKLLSGTLIKDNYNNVVMKLKKGDDPREYLASYERDSKAWDNLYNNAEEE